MTDIEINILCTDITDVTPITYEFYDFLIEQIALIFYLTGADIELRNCIHTGLKVVSLFILSNPLSVANSLFTRAISFLFLYLSNQRLNQFFYH